MDKQEVVFNKLKKLIVQELGVKPEIVTYQANLTHDFGADSLDALELFNEVESEFLITITDQVATSMKVVADLVDYIVKEVSESYFE